MSKTTKATNNVQSAQAIVDELEARKTEMAASRASDERELAEISFAAHGAGDQKALARLETIKARIVKREVDAKSLNAAVDEAKRRFADARNAEAMAEAARVAEEVAEIAGILRESGAEADKALARFIAATQSVSKCIAGLQERGVNSPNGAQLLALGRRAVLAAMIETPLRREFEHLSPRERTRFSEFCSGWANALLRNVGKTKQEKVA
jgi:hypothetical protein